MYSPPSTTAPPPDRNARYAYLVGRLRSRQITMEEATELFNLMQAAVSRAEAARLAALAQSAPPAPTGAQPVVPGSSPSGGSGDDLLLVGMLAMGAGVGLLAALTKRIQELTPTAPSAPTPPK
jgi:hypothetical protein